MRSSRMGDCIAVRAPRDAGCDLHAFLLELRPRPAAHGADCFGASIPD